MWSKRKHQFPPIGNALMVEKDEWSERERERKREREWENALGYVLAWRGSPFCMPSLSGVEVSLCTLCRCDKWKSVWVCIFLFKSGWFLSLAESEQWMCLCLSPERNSCEGAASCACAHTHTHTHTDLYSTCLMISRPQLVHKAFACVSHQVYNVVFIGSNMSKGFNANIWLPSIASAENQYTSVLLWECLEQNNTNTQSYTLTHTHTECSASMQSPQDTVSPQG